jgi:hypothetical protein
MTLRYIFVFFLISHAHCVLFAQKKEANNPTSVFELLRKIDDVYADGFSTTGIASDTSGIFSDEGSINPRIKKRWSFTTKERQFYALQLTLLEKQEILETSQGGEIIPEKQLFFFDPDFSGTVAVLSGILSETTSLVTPRIIHMHKPDDMTESLPVFRAMWVCGRGYTSFLNQIISIENQSQGILRISANGFLFTKATGIWELVIDTNADYMVTKATFTPSAGSTVFEIKNEGIRRNDNCVFPSKATFRIIFRKRAVENSFEFENAKLEFNEKLFQETKAYFLEKQPDGVILHDHKVTPPETIFVGEKIIEKRSIDRENNYLWHAIVVGNLILALAFVFYCLLTFRKNKKKE